MPRGRSIVHYKKPPGKKEYEKAVNDLLAAGWQPGLPENFYVPNKTDEGRSRTILFVFASYDKWRGGIFTIEGEAVPPFTLDRFSHEYFTERARNKKWHRIQD